MTTHAAAGAPIVGTAVEGPLRLSRAAPTKTRGFDILTEAAGHVVANVPLRRFVPEWRANDEATAARIVRTYNAHADMLAALQLAETCMVALERAVNPRITTFAMEDELRVIRAAIAKAVGASAEDAS